MKRYPQFFVFIIASCFIQCVFGQDSIGKVYSIKFSGYKSNLSKEAKAILNEVAKKMKDQPGCRFALTSYCVTENRRMNQANWDRPNNIINYLVTKHGIDSDRFIFNYGSDDSDCNRVDLKFTEQRLSTDAPPHPNLRKKIDHFRVCCL
jgi:hypothetical protein